MMISEMLIPLASTAVAFCSNRTRTPAACVEKFQTTLALTGENADNTKALSKMLGQQIVTICLNRGDADTVAKALLVLDNMEIIRGCVSTAVDLHSRGLDNDINVRNYLNNFESRFTEDFDYMTTKLRWLNMHPNYANSIDEVERLLEALNLLIVEKMQSMETV